MQQRFRIVMQLRVLLGQIGQFQLLRLEPLAVRPLPGELHFQFFVRDQASGEEVHQEHLAWLQAAFFLHVFRLYRQHPDLGGHDDLVVMRQVIAGRAQAVAIQHRADVMAVGEHDGGGAVPRLHQRRVVFVEVAFFLRHVDVGLPRFGNHHHDGFLQRAPCHQQEFQHVIEGARVGKVRLDDGEQILELVAEALAHGDTLPRGHQVLVAAQGVDLPVVAHEAIGLRAVPRGEGVGGEARVHHGQVALVVMVFQVRVERKQLAGRQHTFIDDDPGVQAAHIHLLPRVADLGAANECFARQVQRVIEAVVTRGVGAATDNDLLDEGHRIAGSRADIGLVRPDGHFPETENGKPLVRQGVRQADLEFRAPGIVPGQEQVADGIGAGFGQGKTKFSGYLLHEFVRDGGQYARTVAGILFETAAAAVIHPGVDMVGVRQDLMAGYAFDVGDKAHTTGILFEGGVIETMLGGKPDLAVDSLIFHAFNSSGGAISNCQFIWPSKNQRS